MRFLPLAFAAALGLAGCVASGALYRHPGTQETRICAQHGWGGVATAVAATRYASCKDEVEAAGYEKGCSLTLQEVHCLGWTRNENGTCSNERVNE
jgi:hypothetical protein